MSDTSKTMAGMAGTTDGLMPMVLSDLSDEQARQRSRGNEGPSIAWTVGHLLNYRYMVMEMLGAAQENPFAGVIGEHATDGSDYPPIADLLSAWQSLAPEFAAVLDGIEEERWNAPGTGPHDEKNLRDQITFFAWHEGYHLGALGAMRKQMGMMGPAEKVMAAMEAEAAAAEE